MLFVAYVYLSMSVGCFVATAKWFDSDSYKAARAIRLGFSLLFVGMAFAILHLLTGQ